MLAWLTPDSSAADGVIHCRRLAIPTEYLPIVAGALDMLTNSYNWEAFGDYSPDDAIADMLAMIEDFHMSEGCRIGTLFNHLSASTPDGALACDGSTYNDLDYPALAALIAPAFDNGDGTFTLPDLRGRSVLGAGAGAGLTNRSVGDTGGVEEHALAINEMPRHHHSYLPPALNPDVEGPGIPDIGATILGPLSTTGQSGGYDPHENMPPFLALNAAVWHR